MISSSRVPDRIHEAMIGLETDLLRYDAGVRRKIRNLLKQLEKDLVSEISTSQIDELSPFQKSRLQRLLSAAEMRIKDSYANAKSMMDDELRGLVQVSDQGLVMAMNEAVGASLFQPVNWTADQLAAITSDTLIQGAPSSAWWSRQSDDLVKSFSDQMRMGMLRGESIQEMVWRVVGKKAGPKNPATAGIMKTARRNAEALVRTSVITVNNDAHLVSFQANADILNGIEWISTLDSRTTPQCRALDGKRWDLNYKPVGHSLPFPGPTAHWNCRSGQIPWTKTWEQLAKEAGGDTKLAKELDKIPVGRRASMGGPVSGDLTYEKWFGGLNSTTQQEILGPGKYSLWKSEKLSFADMLNFDGTPLTLTQLKAKYL